MKKFINKIRAIYEEISSSLLFYLIIELVILFVILGVLR